MIVVLERVSNRHPDISEIDVTSAWKDRIKTQFRIDGDRPFMVAVGVANSGKPLEMIAFEDGNDTIVFHALTPPTKKFLKELKLL